MEVNISLDKLLINKIKEDINILKDKQALLDFIAMNTSEDDVLTATILENLIENDFARDFMSIANISYAEREDFLEKFKQKYYDKGIQKRAVEQALIILLSAFQFPDDKKEAASSESVDSNNIDNVVRSYKDGENYDVSNNMEENDINDRNVDDEIKISDGNIEDSICPKCKTIIIRASKFCPECGYNLLGSEGKIINGAEQLNSFNYIGKFKEYVSNLKNKFSEIMNNNYDNNKKIVITLGIIMLVFMISFAGRADKRFDQNLQESYVLINRVNNTTKKMKYISPDDKNDDYIKELKQCKDDIEAIYSLRDIWFLSKDRKERNNNLLPALQLREKIIEKQIELFDKHIYSDKDKIVAEIEKDYEDLDKIKLNDMYIINDSDTKTAIK